LTKKESVVYFHSFLPVNSQMTTKITAITSSICINEPTPGKAKNPTNQSSTIMIAIVNHLFIANSPIKAQLVLSTYEVVLFDLSFFLIGLGAPDAMARRRTESSDQTISEEM